VVLPVMAWHTRRSAAARILLLAACATLPLASACGKKGPPLVPLARVPVAPLQVSASRAGDVVTISFTVPGANVSGIRPADIERVDVYAWTGPDLPVPRAFKVAKVVASVPVRTPPPPAEGDTGGTVAPPPPVGPGVDQGSATELTDTLAADAFTPIELPEAGKTPAPARSPRVTPPDAAPLPPPLTRHYIVVGVNHGGRRGAPAPPAAVPLWAAPPPPLHVSAKALETGTELAWTAPAHLRRPVMLHEIPAPARPAAAKGANAAGQRPPAANAPVVAPRPPLAEPDDDDLEDEPSASPPAIEPTPEASPPPTDNPPVETEASPEANDSGLLPARLAIPWPAVSVGYHVYEVVSQDASHGAPAQPGGPAPAVPKRLTTVPVKQTTFADKSVQYGVERCYLVRTVETIGGLSAESEWSAPACVKPADVFPPPSPTSLAAVASTGAISLIWEGSDVPDLAGYIVLRGVAPGAPTERLTKDPIRETTFRDTTVSQGTRYVYAVIAVDTAKPPNASAPSNRVEATAQ